MLNLDKFAEIKKQREKNKKKCYKKVFKQIITFVEMTISQDIHFLVYEMQPFVFGEADYEMLECVHFIINKIKEDKNFKKILTQISYYEPNLLYITWDLTKAI
jgi:hypothetical protein